MKYINVVFIYFRISYMHVAFISAPSPVCVVFLFLKIYLSLFKHRVFAHSSDLLKFFGILLVIRLPLKKIRLLFKCIPS